MGRVWPDDEPDDRRRWTRAEVDRLLLGVAVGALAGVTVASFVIAWRLLP